MLFTNLLRFNLMLWAALFFALATTSLYADVCANCAGSGKMLSNFSVVNCSKCGGDGVVNSGGIAFPQVPEMGYQTNKFDLKEKVEDGGWKVAWADDITETDAGKGVVSIGVSVVTTNPAPFIAWLENLVQRTIDSLNQSASNLGPGVKAQMVSTARTAIEEAIKSQSGRELTKSLGTIDIKTGAIRYSGRNFVGDKTISRTWGMKPYIAIRLRSSANTGNPTPTPGATQIGSPTPNGTTAPNDKPNFDDTTLNYDITLHTGSRIGAGTDANVFISIVGSRCAMGTIPLDNSGNDRERNDVDLYHVKCRNLGDIKSLTIWHDNRGVGPGWFLDKVEVTEVSTSKKWTFKCDRWLATDEDDHKILRELTIP